MRIDASNLLITAQTQARPVHAAKAAEHAEFEPLTFPKVEPARDRPRDIAPAGSFRPLGAQIDIKI